MKVFKWFLRIGGLICLIVSALSSGKASLAEAVAAAIMFSMALGIYIGEWSGKSKK